MPPTSILLSLASKQIWPQVLAVAHLKPARVFLLHSEDAAESKGPPNALNGCSTIPVWSPKVARDWNWFQIPISPGSKIAWMKFKRTTN